MKTVSDQDVKRIALREYPKDYSMQKYTYDKQLSAKRYMDTVSDQDVKRIALHEYPNDYSMQKYTYDTQLMADFEAWVTGDRLKSQNMPQQQVWCCWDFNVQGKGNSLRREKTVGPECQCITMRLAETA